MGHSKLFFLSLLIWYFSQKNYLFLYGRWVIEVGGAPGTLYSNETYQLQVDFPENYPMEAPQVIIFILIYINSLFCDMFWCLLIMF